MKVSTWQKDMRLINDALQYSDTPAPLFAACMPIYNAAMALGHGMDDTAAVYAVLERMVGKTQSKRGYVTSAPARKLSMAKAAFSIKPTESLIW